MCQILLFYFKVIIESHNSDTQPFLATIEKEMCFERKQSPLMVAMCSFRERGTVIYFDFGQHAKAMLS